MTRLPGSWQKRWFDRFYNARPGWTDGTTQFHALISTWSDARAETSVGRAPSARRPLRILEIGAGPTNPTSSFLASLGALHGVDLDAEVEHNEALESAHVLGEDQRYPFADEHFDLCVSNYVVEHVADPVAHLREVARVLAPGGAYLFRAPNLWHPISLVAAATPHWFHEQVANRLRGLAEEAHDPYPTLHRLNDRRRITRAALDAGLSVDALRMIEPDPSYGASSRLLFVLFMAYERLVNSTKWLAGLRVNILATLVKPEQVSS